MEFSIFSRYNPKINDISFDADLGSNIKLRTNLASYPLETGFEVNNAIIAKQSVVKLKMGIGKEKVTSLLDNPLDDLSSNWDSYLSGLASNFVGSGLGNYLLGLISKSLITSGDNRMSKALVALQALQLSGESFDLIVYNAGILKGMVITEISVDSTPDNSEALIFNIELRQEQSTDTVRTIGAAEPPTVIGEIFGTKEVIPDNE